LYAQRIAVQLDKIHVEERKEALCDTILRLLTIKVTVLEIIKKYAIKRN